MTYTQRNKQTKVKPEVNYSNATCIDNALVTHLTILTTQTHILKFQYTVNWEIIVCKYPTKILCVHEILTHPNNQKYNYCK